MIDLDISWGEHTTTCRKCGKLMVSHLENDLRPRWAKSTSTLGKQWLQRDMFHGIAGTEEVGMLNLSSEVSTGSHLGID